MERLFLECAIRAALLIGGAAIVLYAMRVKAAGARHAVWTAMVLVMLALPLWTAWGPKLSLRLLPPLSEGPANGAYAPAATLPGAFSSSAQLSPWQVVLLGVYLSGVCLLLIRLGIGTVQARKLVRDAIPHGSFRTSSRCATPMTVGFLRPSVVLPENWRAWPQAQLEAVLTHENEHARRRDPLVQWLALLNRVLFWFHPAAWWLERHLSSLAEEVCDNVVLARGHNPSEYAEYLLDLARSVARSGSRLNIAGMAMPGGALPGRIRKIMAGGSMARISRVRMTFVVVACVVTSSALAAANLDRARQNPAASAATPTATSASSPASKFVLGDLKIEGDVHERDAVRERVLKAWKDREFDDAKDLQGAVLEDGVRSDFQRRGYFKVDVQDGGSQVLGLSNSKQSVRISASVTEGDQYHLGTFRVQNALPGHALAIPEATLREQFHLRNEDLFNVLEIRAGMVRLVEEYGRRGYPDCSPEPETNIDDASRQINVVLRVTEGAHKP
jgi:hypothetical protein